MKGSTDLYLKADTLIKRIRKRAEEGLQIITEAKDRLRQHAWPRPFASNDP